eukprot:TRINITY_DN7019_c0_g1_i2.p1 TRINITY_DN7019_c0_g1~~TRINITY_DN7019_c0_g1_i2.p1  ORF type:complete len:696 (-),score=181.71 TRINITY_DN7019_c0_g1_i2:109-2196(-)
MEDIILELLNYINPSLEKISIEKRKWLSKYRLFKGSNFIDIILKLFPTLTLSRSEIERVGTLLIDHGMIESFDNEKIIQLQDNKNLFFIKRDNNVQNNIKTIDENRAVQHLQKVIKIADEKYCKDPKKKSVSKLIDPTIEESKQIFPTLEEEDDDEIIHSFDPETKKKILIGASLEKLIEVLIDPDSYIPNLQVDIIFTHKTFVSTIELLKMLKEQYILEPPNQEEEKEITSTSTNIDIKKQFDVYITGMRRRIYSLLNDWIRLVPGDFQDEAKEAWEDFINTIEKEHKTKGLYYRQVFDEMMKKSLENCETPSYDLKTVDSTFTLFDLEPSVLALQMTLLQYENFKNIKRDELINQNWIKRPEKAKNVQAFVNTFNQVSNWATSEIVKCGKVANRIKVLSYFIKIASEMEKLNNFDGVMSIIAAVNSAPITRLKKTWEGLPVEDLKEKERLQEIMSYRGNYSFYRNHFMKAKKPKLLYLGLSLSDLVFIDEGNPNYLTPVPKNNPNNTNNNTNINEVTEPVKILNMEKRHLMSKVFSSITDLQNTGYNLLNSIPSIKRWLTEITPISNEQAYYLSVSIESKNEEETIENLLIQQQSSLLENNELLSKLEKLEKKVQELQASTIRLESQNKKLKEEISKYENESLPTEVNHSNLSYNTNTVSKKSTTRILIETRRKRKQTNNLPPKPKLFDLFKN